MTTVNTGLFDFGTGSGNGAPGSNIDIFGNNNSKGVGFNFNPNPGNANGGLIPTPDFTRRSQDISGFGFTDGSAGGGDVLGPPHSNPIPGAGTSPSPVGGTNTPNPLSSGVLPFYGGTNTTDLSHNFNKIFGPSGSLLLQAILSGGYNPQVFDALIKQLQPQIDRGVATIGANAGASGTRFGSGYDLALGDYLSQVESNEQGLAANLYEDAVHNSFSLLGGTIPFGSQYQSNKGGFGSSLLTSLLGTLGKINFNVGGNNSTFPGGSGIPGISF